MLNYLKNPEVRKYIYSVTSAVIPLLVVCGVALPPGVAESLLTLLAAILGFGAPLLARVNTPIGDGVEKDELIDAVDSVHELGSDSDQPHEGLG